MFELFEHVLPLLIIITTNNLIIMSIVKNKKIDKCIVIHNIINCLCWLIVLYKYF
jgi:hypothetical protein